MSAGRRWVHAGPRPAPRARRLAAITGILALPATACSSPTPLAHAEFVDRADTVCARAQDDLQRLVGTFPDEVAIETLPGFTQAYADVIPVLEREVEDLRALTPPPAAEEAAARLVEAQARNVRAIRAARGAAMRADIDGFRGRLDEALRAASEFRAAAASVGLAVCGRPVEEPGPTPADPGPTEAEQALLDEAPAAAAAAGCSEILAVEPAAGDQAHAEEIPPLGTYPSVPPASGPHSLQTAPAGVYPEPPPMGGVIHSLEHGAVAVWVGGDDPDAAALEDLATFFADPARQEHVIVAPYDYPEQGEAGRLPDGVGMALVAWHRLQTCERASLPVAFAFVHAYRLDPRDAGRYRGEAPEAGVEI